MAVKHKHNVNLYPSQCISCLAGSPTPELPCAPCIPTHRESQQVPEVQAPGTCRPSYATAEKEGGRCGRAAGRSGLTGSPSDSGRILGFLGLWPTHPRSRSENFKFFPRGTIRGTREWRAVSGTHNFLRPQTHPPIQPPPV